MANNKTFGPISGIPVGAIFNSRSELARTGLHRQMQAGITGTGDDGAESIVLSGGYEDDQDLGDVIVYTGQGGPDPNSGKQVSDQKLTLGNLALVVSHTRGLPEGAHIKPLGRPHNGPDTIDKILCLCANHHVLFDLHGFSISETHELIGLPGRLRTDPRHMLSKQHLVYRMEHY